MSDIIAVTPSNVFDRQKMKYLLASAVVNRFHLNVIGVGQPFAYISKILYLHEYLLKLPAESNPIICFTDAYDVIYLDNLDTIKDKFLLFGADIVWSVERYYSYQLTMDQEFYNSITADSASPYKYINTGTFIGYKDALLNLLNDIVNGSIKNEKFLDELAKNHGNQTSHERYNLQTYAVDQTIFSHHIATNWNKYNIVLDTQCLIFYLPCHDWFAINAHIDGTMKILSTGNTPSIIHVPNKVCFEYLLKDLFVRKYKYIPDGSEYVEEKNT